MTDFPSSPVSETPTSLIDRRLTDLREANDVFRGMDWDKSRDIQRNDREIRWLIDLRTVLTSDHAPTPAEADSDTYWRDMYYDLLNRARADWLATGVAPTPAAQPCGLRDRADRVLGEWWFWGDENLSSSERAEILDGICADTSTDRGGDSTDHIDWDTMAEERLEQRPRRVADSSPERDGK